MNNNQNESIPQDELIENLLQDFGLDDKEEIEMFIESHFTPKEWVPIEGTDLLIGISVSGGMMMCRMCDCLWSLNYYCINISNADDEEEIKAITSIWQDSKTWYQCPCCSYHSIRKG